MMTVNDMAKDMWCTMCFNDGHSRNFTCTDKLEAIRKFVAKKVAENRDVWLTVFCGNQNIMPDMVCTGSKGIVAINLTVIPAREQSPELCLEMVKHTDLILEIADYIA